MNDLAAGGIAVGTILAAVAGVWLWASYGSIWWLLLGLPLVLLMAG